MENDMEQCVLTKANVPVYACLNPHLHSFCLCLYVKAGPLYEGEGENGITHLFEHAVIRNMDRRMNGGLYPLLDRLGLSLGGATYKEFVQFSMSGAPVHWREAVEIFMGLLEPLCLSEREVSIEKKRVEAEIREYGGAKSLEAKTERQVWKGTSLAMPITGTKKSLKALGLKELVRFRESFFGRENLFFYVTGCPGEEGLSCLTEKLDQREFPAAGVRRENLAPAPEAFFHRAGTPRVFKGKDTEVSISFDVDASRYGDAALNLFFDMIFAGDSCPFYQELSERTGYLYSYGQQLERYKNLGSLQVHYQVSPGKLLDSFKRAVDIFEQLKRRPADLSFMRPNDLADGAMILDDADELNWNRAYDCHILEEPYPDLEAKKEAFRQVTEGRMQDMARDIFRTANMTVVVKGDKKQIPKGKLAFQMRRLG